MLPRLQHAGPVAANAVDAGDFFQSVNENVYACATESAAHGRERKFLDLGKRQARKAAGQHGLPRSRRAAHEDVVPAHCRELQRPARLVLAVHLDQVVLERDSAGRVGCLRGGDMDCLDFEEVVDHGQQRLARDDLHVAGEGCLDGVVGRDEDSLVAKLP